MAKNLIRSTVIIVLIITSINTAAGSRANELDSTFSNFHDDDVKPKFAEVIPNVTATVGRDALLACVVDNLNGFKVAWVRIDTQTILTIHDKVISQDRRITLSHTDHRSWYLHIQGVRESDRGLYLCQLNTDPMLSTEVYVQIVVPPTIVDEETSSDLVVREMTNVTLNCKAQGHPEPYIMWRREDGEDFIINGESVNVVDGEVLHITRVSRLHIGAYLCIASNGVPPSISKRIQLRVHFPPMLSIPNQLEGAYLGQDVSLECHSEAYPRSINYWTTATGEMIISGDKYEVVSMDNGYNIYMMLKIRNMGRVDFGTYSCIAKNSLGETDGVIRLDEIPVPTTLSTSTALPLMSTTPRKRVRHRERPLEHQELNDFGLEEWRDTDYDAEDYVFPSNGPQSAHHPPGAYSGVSRQAYLDGGLATLLICCAVLLPGGR